MSNQAITITQYKSPFGMLKLGEHNGELCLVDWLHRKQRTKIDSRLTAELKVPFEAGDSPLLLEAAKQLDYYFEKKLREFDIPIKLIGSDFQTSVWKALVEIP